MAKTEQEPVNKFAILKNSFQIRILLEDKWRSIGWTMVDVSEDSEKFGRTGINKVTLSRYLNSFDMKTGEYKHSKLTSLTEENIAWLCERWGISVKLKVGLINAQQDVLIKKAQSFDPYNIYK